MKIHDWFLTMTPSSPQINTTPNCLGVREIVQNYVGGNYPNGNGLGTGVQEGIVCVGFFWQELPCLWFRSKVF